MFYNPELKLCLYDIMDAPDVFSHCEDGIFTVTYGSQDYRFSKNVLEYCEYFKKNLTKETTELKIHLKWKVTEQTFDLVMKLLFGFEEVSIPEAELLDVLILLYELGINNIENFRAKAQANMLLRLKNNTALKVYQIGMFYDIQILREHSINVLSTEGYKLLLTQSKEVNCLPEDWFLKLLESYAENKIKSQNTFLFLKPIEIANIIETYCEANYGKNPRLKRNKLKSYKLKFLFAIGEKEDIFKSNGMDEDILESSSALVAAALVTNVPLTIGGENEQNMDTYYTKINKILETEAGNLKERTTIWDEVCEGFIQEVQSLRIKLVHLVKAFPEPDFSDSNRAGLSITENNFQGGAMDLSISTPTIDLKKVFEKIIPNITQETHDDPRKLLKIGSSYIQSYKVNFKTFKRAEMIPYVEAVAYFQSVAVIDLSFSDTDADDEMIRILTKALKTLQSVFVLRLWFKKCRRFHDGNINQICDAIENYGILLEFHIALNDCVNLTGESINRLSKMLYYKNSLQIFKLFLNECKNVDDQSLIYLSKALENKKTISTFCLDLKGCCDIADTGIIALSKAINNMKSLSLFMLDLWRCHKLTDLSIEALAKALYDKTAVTYFKIGLCELVNITDSSISLLSKAIINMKSLTTFGYTMLNNANVKDEGFGTLCNVLTQQTKLSDFAICIDCCPNFTEARALQIAKALEKMEALSSVHFSLCSMPSITNAVISAVSRAISNISLKNLFFGFPYCTNVTDTSLKQLAEAIKNQKYLKKCNCFVIGTKCSGPLLERIKKLQK